MRKKILGLVKFFIGWPLSIAAIFFIFKLTIPNIERVSLQITSINIFLLIIGQILFIVYFILRGFLWHSILKEKDYSLSFKETVYLWGMSEVKRFVPGNIWAIMSRTNSFANKQVEKKIILSALFIETELVFIASFFLSLFSVFYIFNTFFPFLQGKDLYALSILIISIFIIFLFLFYKCVPILDRLASSKFSKHIIPEFSFLTNLYLFIIAVFCLIFFGLGTYFSILSIVHIPVGQTSLFVSLFAFSFFAGYATIIAPMGLGVREGILTAILSKFITFSASGFAAIFARICIIIAELEFLFLSFLFVKIQNNFIKKVENFIVIKKYEVLLFISVCIYTLYFSAASIFRYINFYTGRFDLGNADQTVWNTIHGRIFQFTNPDGVQIVSRLSQHADFMLVLLAPFYWLWQDPRMLLLIQTIVISFGAFFIFAIGNNILKNKKTSFAFAIAYLINPAINQSNLYDFHAVTFATTFFLGAFYFLKTKKYFLYCLFLLLAVITKEQIWIITALFGIYTCFQKKVLLGTSIFIFSVVSFIFIFFYAIPTAHQGAHFAFSYYSDFGSSPKEIITSIIFSPFKTLGIVFALERLEYLKQLFFPLGFLAIFSLKYLIFAIPDIAINLLSHNEQLHQIYYQYTAAITPFIFIASINGFKNFQEKFPGIKKNLILIYFISMILIGAYLYGPIPGERFPNTGMFDKPNFYAKIIDDFIKDIPTKYSIAATNNLGSHLSHREKIFTIPLGVNDADIVLFLLNDKFAQPSLTEQKKMAAQLKINKNYIEIFKIDDFIVFEKRNLYIKQKPNIDKTKLFPLSIQTLQNRDFNDTGINIEKKIGENKYFTSFSVFYNSDGLKLYSAMDVPKSNKKDQIFPVVVLNHGFVDRASYNEDLSYKEVEDYFAKNGFLVLKPDYRGHGKSEKDDNLSFVASYPIDVLNLLSSIKSIPQANEKNVFLWGHAVGGGIALETVEASNQNPNTDYSIKGIAVWAPTTDAYKTYVRYNSLFPNSSIPYKSLFPEIGDYSKNPVLWQSISPIFYADDITSPIHITHGVNDEIIPYNWSVEFYNDLISLNKKASLTVFQDDHTLKNHLLSALKNDLLFFKKNIVEN